MSSSGQDNCLAVIPRSSSKSLAHEGATSFGIERFVAAEIVAEFLSVSRADVLRLTRAGSIRGYAYRGQQRHVYRYRLSEVSVDFTALGTNQTGKILPAASVSRRRTSDG